MQKIQIVLKARGDTTEFVEIEDEHGKSRSGVGVDRKRDDGYDVIELLVPPLKETPPLSPAFGMPGEYLKLAREIAVDVEEVYGSLSQYEFEQLRTKGPWNDMSSVQAVLCALSPEYRERMARFGAENRARIVDLKTTLPRREEEIALLADERVGWLLDAVAMSTQDRRLLVGDADEDKVLTEALRLNAKKALMVFAERLLAGKS